MVLNLEDTKNPRILTMVHTWISKGIITTAILIFYGIEISSAAGTSDLIRRLNHRFPKLKELRG